MVKSLDDGNGAETKCAQCGKKLYIWDGTNQTACHVATHCQLYCSKDCYDIAGEEHE